MEMEKEPGRQEDESRATFIVQVRFQRNGTWQGAVSWTEEKKTQQFRSTLELLKLMDDALRQGQENGELCWLGEEE